MSDPLVKCALLLDEIKVNSNRDLFGATKVKVIATVAAIQAGEDNPKTIAGVIAQAKSVLAGRRVIEVDHVKDHSKMYFGPTGVAVAMWPETPELIDLTVHVVDIDQDVREVGKMLGKTLDAIPDTLEALAKEALAAVHPILPAGFVLVRSLTGILAKALAKNKDDQIELFMQTIVKWLNYAHGQMSQTDVLGVTGNAGISWHLVSYPGE